MASPSEMTPKDFEILNRLLKTASPMGAYSMGAVSYLAWQSGVQPDISLLKAAARSRSVEAADRIFKAWWLKIEKRRRAG